MSVSRTGQSNVPGYDELEYTDWLQLRFSDEIFQAYGGPRDQTYAEQRSIDMDVYLANDEVMELVAIDWEFLGFVAMNGGSASETEPGYAEVSANWEINSGEGEWILTDQTGIPHNDSQGQKTLDWYETVIFPSVQDSVNGMGSGTGPSSDTYRSEKNLRELYGTGPFVDVNDRLDLREEITVEHMSMDVNVKVSAKFLGLVYELDGARPELAAPF